MFRFDKETEREMAGLMVFSCFVSMWNSCWRRGHLGGVRCCAGSSVRFSSIKKSLPNSNCWAAIAKAGSITYGNGETLNDSAGEEVGN